MRRLAIAAGVLLVMGAGCFNEPKIDAGSVRCSTEEDCPTGYVCTGASASAFGRCARPTLDGAVADAPFGQGLDLGGGDEKAADGIASEVGGVLDAPNDGGLVLEVHGDLVVDQGTVSLDDARNDVGSEPIDLLPDAISPDLSISLDTGVDLPSTGSGGVGGAGGSSGAGSGGIASAGGAAGAGGIAGSSNAGGSATGGVPGTGGIASTGGTSSTGGSGAGGSSPQGVVGVFADPRGNTTTGTTAVAVDIGTIDSPSYILVAAVSNATDGSTSTAVTKVSYGGLSFVRLVGGNIAGTAFSSEFWGAHSSTVQLPSPLTVTTSAAGNTGVSVWALSGVNASNPVGSSIAQGQFTGTSYQESFSNKRPGSMLFGAFFDTNYAEGAGGGYLAITASAGSRVAQTFAGYYVWSASASSSGLQTIGATLPGTWTIEHSAIEIVP